MIWLVCFAFVGLFSSFSDWGWLERGLKFGLHGLGFLGWFGLHGLCSGSPDRGWAGLGAAWLVVGNEAWFWHGLICLLVWFCFISLSWSVWFGLFSGFSDWEWPDASVQSSGAWGSVAGGG